MSEPALNIENNHKPLLFKLVLAVGIMFVFAFALVPLYDVFCDITGLNGKPSLQPAIITPTPVIPTLPELTSQETIDEGLAGISKDSSQQQIVAPSLAVKLMTQLQGQLSLNITPEVPTIKTVPGKTHQVDFIAHNPSKKPLVIRAVPSVVPGLAAQYLKKFECFCFQEQHLAAGETKVMPLQFVIDKAIGEDMKEITISYAIFDITKKAL